MKISEGIKKYKGRSVAIPDCGRDDLIEFFKEKGFKKGVEVGVFMGAFTEVLGKSGLEVYGVDPWLAYEDYPYYSEPQKQSRCDSQYEAAKKLLEPYKNVTLIRKTSMDAAADFENDSIDFVYIDGNHSFRYVAEDICEWVKKVRPGGVVCGHDYMYARPANFHVRYVVDAYVESHAIKNLWILGEKVAKPGEKRDRWRSWMFIKE